MTAPEAARRGHVLCIRLDSLGDVLLTGGAVRAVAGTASRVTMLVAPSQTAAAALLLRRFWARGDGWISAGETWPEGATRA